MTANLISSFNGSLSNDLLQRSGIFLLIYNHVGIAVVLSYASPGGRYSVLTVSENPLTLCLTYFD